MGHSHAIRWILTKFHGFTLFNTAQTFIQSQRGYLVKIHLVAILIGQKANFCDCVKTTKDSDVKVLRAFDNV